MHKELSKALELLKTDDAAGKKAYLDSLHVFAERMADVLEVASPHVVLAEAAPGMGGDGFGKRWPTAENVAIGGTNPILVDRVGAAFLGLWDNEDLARELGGHKTSPLIETAAKRFGVDVASPVVEGDGAALLATRRPVHFVSMSGFTLHSDASEADATPVVHARHVTTAIDVDGTQEAAWASAAPVTFDTDWSGAKTPVRTHVRVLWSKDALYTLWDLEGAGLFVDASRPVATERAKLYEEDCVELFLAPDAAQRGRYFEVEVGPLGHFLDLGVDKPRKKSDVAWSSQPQIATKVDGDKRRVIIETALRSPDVTRALVAGAKLPFALYRMEGRSPRLYLAWSPTRTPKPDFHVPEAFGTLVLE
jgi:hypothetical protein